ncbi:unnamed protein product [Brassica oleracea]
MAFCKSCNPIKIERRLLPMFSHKKISLLNSSIIEEFQKCHLEHPIGKFFGECTELKVKVCLFIAKRKAVKRKVNFERSKKLQERLKTIRKEETAET